MLMPGNTNPRLGPARTTALRNRVSRMVPPPRLPIRPPFRGFGRILGPRASIGRGMPGGLQPPIRPGALDFLQPRGQGHGRPGSVMLPVAPPMGPAADLPYEDLASLIASVAQAPGQPAATPRGLNLTGNIRETALITPGIREQFGLQGGGPSSPILAGGLVPLGGGQYIDPESGQVFGLGNYLAY